jgi:hypothetical protein
VAEGDTLTVRSDGNVSFRRLTPGDLKDLAAVAQTLDNQWVPRRLLSKMITGGRSLADVAAEREAAVRVEYLRAVLNAEQLVVNRAYFFNSPAVFRDFAEPGEGRDAFRGLLGAGVLVPFLFNESSPVEGATTGMTRLRGEELWQQIAAETEMSCVRLSWSDATNMESVRHGLWLRFHEFVAGLRGKCLDGGDRIFASHLAVPAEAVPHLRQRLLEAADWAYTAEHLVTREQFYAKFVVDDNTRPVDGRYSATKPFAEHLKLLVDLAYNTTLPETLDRYPLRPEDSLHRSALQEWKQRSGTSASPVDAQEAAESLILTRLAYDRATASLPLPSLADVSLAHVAVVRGSEQWHSYITALRDLVDHPQLYESKATALRTAYAALLAELGRVAGPQRSAVAVQPSLGFNLDFAGVLVKVRYFAERAVYRVVGAAPEQPRRTVGMSRVVVTGDALESTGARTAGHHLAADLRPFHVDDPAEFLGWLEGRLAAAGIQRIGGGSAVRDGGLEQDQEVGG